MPETIKLNKQLNYLIEEINQNIWMSRKHKKICTTLNYIEKQNWLIILASKITEYVSISVFVLLTGIPIGISSSAIELKICAITSGIKKYNSIIKKKKKKHEKNKSKLYILEVLISIDLILVMINLF